MAFSSWLDFVRQQVPESWGGPILPPEPDRRLQELYQLTEPSGFAGALGTSPDPFAAGGRLVQNELDRQNAQQAGPRGQLASALVGDAQQLYQAMLAPTMRDRPEHWEWSAEKAGGLTPPLTAPVGREWSDDPGHPLYVSEDTRRKYPHEYQPVQYKQLDPRRRAMADMAAGSLSRALGMAAAGDLPAAAAGMAGVVQESPYKWVPASRQSYLAPYEQADLFRQALNQSGKLSELASQERIAETQAEAQRDRLNNPLQRAREISNAVYSNVLEKTRDPELANAARIREEQRELRRLTGAPPQAAGGEAAGQAVVEEPVYRTLTPEDVKKLATESKTPAQVRSKFYGELAAAHPKQRAAYLQELCNHSGKFKAHTSLPYSSAAFLASACRCRCRSISPAVRAG